MGNTSCSPRLFTLAVLLHFYTSILDLCWRRRVDWYRERALCCDAESCDVLEREDPGSRRPKVPKSQLQTPGPRPQTPQTSNPKTVSNKRSSWKRRKYWRNREKTLIKKIGGIKWEEERGEQRHRRSEYTEEIIEEIIILKKLLLSHFYRSNQIITLNGPIVAKQFQWQKLLSCIGLSLISSSWWHPYTPNLRSITPSTNLCKHAIDIRIRCLL